MIVSMTRLPSDTLGELVTTKAKTYGDNDVLAQAKVNWLRGQMACLVVGGFLLVTAYGPERMYP